MASFSDSINEYREQLSIGAIQIAYKGLMEFVMNLRTKLNYKYPEYFVSGSIYYGYMDMTYFSFFPKSFAQKKLKIAIVFLHEAFRFEVWLAGNNKQVQTKYWKMIKESGWNKYPIVPTTKGYDSIIEDIIVENPDFSDLEGLSQRIERSTMKFISDVNGFISSQ
jgi:hypothetical protein